MIRFRRRPLCIAAVMVSLAGCSGGSVTPPPRTESAPPASASPRGSRTVEVPIPDGSPQAAHPWFLAIGDSVTYGYTVDPARAGVNSGWPVQLASLLAAAGRPWKLVDTACPGETLVTYRTGCRQAASAGLNGRTQRDAALQAVALHHADLRAVFIDLGSNDLLEGYRSGAVSNPSALLETIRSGLDQDVTELADAAPGVPIIVANYYNPLANTDASTLIALAAANAMVGTVAARHGAKLADFASAINTAPPPDPHLCDYVDCLHLDIHPTIAGHAALARAALAQLG